MRGDNIAVGSKPITSKSASLIAEDQADRADPGNTPKKQRLNVCGAMSQQSRDVGSQSTPQKFVRLVGCHAPRIKPPAKR